MITNRKLLLSAFVLIVSAVALFFGVIDAGSWIAASGISLGVYSGANVLHAKVTAPPEELMDNEEGEA